MKMTMTMSSPRDQVQPHRGVQPPAGGAGTVQRPQARPQHLPPHQLRHGRHLRHLRHHIRLHASSAQV